MYEFKDFVLDAKEQDGQAELVLVARFVDGKAKFLPGIRVPQGATVAEFGERVVEWAANIDSAVRLFRKRGS